MSTTIATDVGLSLPPFLWAALVVNGCRRWRPLPARVSALRGPTPDRPEPPDGGARVARPAASVERLGSWLRARAGRPPHPGLSTRLGWAVLVAVPFGMVAPPLAVLVGVATWCWPVLRQRRDASRAADLVIRELPEVVDLLVLAVGAGLTVPLAVAAVGRRASGPIGGELRRVQDEVRLGRRSADALDDVPARLGEAVRPLIAALVASERYGAPLHAALERLAVDARADRRRRAEEAARRVPVKLLFPLVLCTLPAFALLTVAPLIAGAVHDLRP